MFDVILICIYICYRSCLEILIFYLKKIKVCYICGFKKIYLIIKYLYLFVINENLILV